MPKIHVSKKITINAPIDKVFNTINNFNTWSDWSPWLIMEPGVKVDVSEDTKSYSWEGNRTGSGNMKIAKEEENKSIAIDLMFLKPYKSKAKVDFYFKGNETSTDVEWTMDSSLPFFMFWMKNSMIEFIGMDYDRGLRLLKDYVEDGKTHSKLNFLGNSEYPGCKYIGINTDCTKETMSKKMAADMPKLMEVLAGKEDIIVGEPFTQYHKWEMVKNQINYTVGVPVKEVPADLPSNIQVGELPKTQVHTVEHVGPYHHLGNAWSTLYTMQRNKEFKSSKVHPFETYKNNPMEVDEKELVTQIHFPLK